MTFLSLKKSFMAKVMYVQRSIFVTLENVNCGYSHTLCMCMLEEIFYFVAENASSFPVSSLFLKPSRSYLFNFNFHCIIQ